MFVSVIDNYRRGSHDGPFDDKYQQKAKLHPVAHLTLEKTYKVLEEESHHYRIINDNNVAVRLFKWRFKVTLLKPNNNIKIL